MKNMKTDFQRYEMHASLLATCLTPSLFHLWQNIYMVIGKNQALLMQPGGEFFPLINNCQQVSHELPSIFRPHSLFKRPV